MQKLAKRLSIVMAALFTITTMLTFAPTVKFASAAVKPVAKVAQQPAATYTQGDILNMKLQAPNYKGKVEYKVVIENVTTKNVVNLFGSANLGYYTKTTPSGLYAFPIHWAFNDAGTYRVFVYVRPAGSKISMSSYAVSNSFAVAAKVTAEDKVAAYEKAPLDTPDQIALADGLKAAAVAEVAKVTDAAAKAAFTTRIEAQDKKVEAARYVHVDSVAGINVNTINVVFNKEVAAKVSNFKIYQSGNQYAPLLVKSVSVNKNTASVVVYNTLVADKTYVVETSTVSSTDAKFAMKEMESKEFTFKKAAAASIAFTATSVHFGDTVGYVIKDAAGNDITANYASGDVTVESSAPSVVSTGLVAASSGSGTLYAIVNVKINNTTIATGNTIITVSDTDASVLKQLGRFSLGNKTYDKPTTTLYTDSTPAQLNYETLDQTGKDTDFSSASPSVVYVSSNPTVAVVNNATGVVYPLAAGTANITVIVSISSGSTVVAQATKTYTVTVKEARKAATISVDKTAVNVVASSSITETVKVKVLDQYGNVFTTADTSLVSAAVETGKSAVVSAGSISLTNGEGNLVLTPGSTNGTAKVTLSATGLSDVVVNVNNVAPAAFNGYIVSTDTNTLDIDQTSDYSKAAATATIHVYVKDVNGNKTSELATTAFTVSTLQTDSSKIVLDLSTNGTVAIDSTAVGTEQVAVKVGSATVGVLTYTVVNSTPVLSTVTQLKSTLSAANSANLVSNYALFGDLDTSVKGAFAGYDQYGNEVQIASGYSITSTDTSIVSSAGVTSATNDGTATLVIKILNKFYTVDVFVK